MNLYELNAKFAEAIGRIESEANPETGELQEGLEKELESIGLEIEDRALQCARYIKNSEAEAEAIKAEECKLAARRTILENRAERITAYLQATIPVGTCYKSANAVIKWGNSERVTIIDEALIPAEYIKKTEVSAPMKNEIKAAIKDGKDVPGAKVEKFNVIKVK